MIRTRTVPEVWLDTLIIRQGWQTVDYPFTIVQMTLNAKGEGSGQMMGATKLSANSVTGDIAFEHYNVSPQLLQNVRRE